MCICCSGDPECREAYHSLGSPWTVGPAFGMGVIKRMEFADFRCFIVGYEYFGISGGLSVLHGYVANAGDPGNTVCISMVGTHTLIKKI